MSDTLNLIESVDEAWKALRRAVKKREASFSCPDCDGQRCLSCAMATEAVAVILHDRKIRQRRRDETPLPDMGYESRYGA